MQVILPLTITDAMVAFTGGGNSAPAEPDASDPPAWAVGTTYAVGALVHRTTTHRRYRSLIPSNTGNTPETTVGVAWEEVGATARWAMFDQLASTSTSKTSPLQVTLTPGLINSLAALGCVGSTLTITVRDGATVIYTRAVSCLDTTPVDSWWGYFFSPIDRRANVVLRDIPTISGSTVEVNLTGTGTVGINSLIVGEMRDTGITLTGVELGINDYSRKEFDPALGYTILERRQFSSRLSLRTIVPAGQVDGVVALLKQLRATPAVWVGDESGRYNGLTVLGFPRDWSVNLDLPDRSYLSIRIEEMT